MPLTVRQLRNSFGPIYRKLSRCGADFSPTAKIILLNILERTGERDYAFPSQEQIATDIGVASVTTVRKALRELIDAGFVAQHRLGQGRTNRYYVDIEGLLAWAEDAQNLTPDQTETSHAEAQELSLSMKDPQEKIQNSVTSDAVAEHVVKAPAATKVTEEWLAEQRLAYAPKIGVKRFNDSVDYWLGHQGFQMQRDKRAFLLKKFDAEVERSAGNGPQRPATTFSTNDPNFAGNAYAERTAPMRAATWAR